MSLERPKFLAELKEIKAADIAASYIALRSKLDLTLLDGFLKQDTDKTNQFFNQFPFYDNDPFTKKERKEFSEWALNYFRDLFNATDKQSGNIIKKYSSRELILLSYVYKFGLGIAVDTQKTFKYLQLAAVYGDPIAILLVGKCYRSAIGISRDEGLGGIYIERAAELPCPQASQALAVILYCEHGDENTQYNLRFKAAETGDAHSFHSLARHYSKGCGILPQDKEMEEKCFALAAMKGVSDSIIPCAQYRIMPIKQKLQCLRLAVSLNEFNGESELGFLQSIPRHAPDIIYHASFLIDRIWPDRFPEYKKDFSDFCEAQPEEVERLSQELGDTDAEIFSLLDDERTNKLLCSLIVDSKANKLATPLLKIICEYLIKDLGKVVEKEVQANVAVKTLIATHCSSSLFSKAAKFAERGKISYQCVMNKMV